jgi:predicted NUDIX family NTP pyrophosphohydrolase
MKTSAGLVIYRRHAGKLEVLLAHPGGPLWARRDEGAWTIPKGELAPDEDPLAAARREVAEETGLRPDGPFLDLGTIQQKGGKSVRAFAAEGDCDPAAIVSNTFELEWPPRSGRVSSFPEIDRAAFFDLATARMKINPAQAALLDELERRLAAGR